MIKSAENSDSQSYDRHEESRNFWRCNFTKACCDFTKTRKSPVYKVVRAILLSKVIYIFLPSLSIRALFKKPICTFLYYCYITYSLRVPLSGSASVPFGPFFRRRSGSAWRRCRLWEAFSFMAFLVWGPDCHACHDALCEVFPPGVRVTTLGFVYEMCRDEDCVLRLCPRKWGFWWIRRLD